MREDGYKVGDQLIMTSGDIQRLKMRSQIQNCALEFIIPKLFLLTPSKID